MSVDEETPLKKAIIAATEDDDELSYDHAPLYERIKDIIKMYWHLGFVSFGGTAANIAFMQDHLVKRNNWIPEDQFLELFALCQGLPGPTSSQLLISTASTHGGMLGGSVAFGMWSFPGCAVLTFAGLFLYNFIDPSHPPNWLEGVAPAAVALIFTTFFGFGKKLDKLGVTIALVACCVSVLISNDAHASQIVYPVLLICGGSLTLLDSYSSEPIGTYANPLRRGASEQKLAATDRKLAYKIGMDYSHGILMFVLWLGLLVGSRVLVEWGVENVYLEIFELFFRVGSLSFGGGVVIVPMLQAEVVPKWMTDEQFFQGLALSQSLPGPVFNYASFLGGTYAGFLGSLVASVALTGPGFILIYSTLPFWINLRGSAAFKAIIQGLNASSIGMIGGSCVFLYAMSVKNAAGAIVFVLCAGLNAYYGVGAPQTIAAGAVVGALFSTFSLGQVPY